MGDLKCTKFLDKVCWIASKELIKVNKNSKLINQLFLTRKKIKTDMLFNLAEIKIIQSNHGVFKSISQSESSINYQEIFIFSDINQSESSFNSHVIFNKFNVHQSELSFESHVFFNKFNVNLSELSLKSHKIFKKFNVNQSELSSSSHEFFNNFFKICGFWGYFHRHCLS